ncbi:MAG: MmgE/PrpD family protein [Nitrososphaerota archaeon]|nr:MmgE/PrpD family protein [Nitrososphaerota archaeon]
MEISDIVSKYAKQTDYEMLESGVKEEAKRRVLDALANAKYSYSEIGSILRNVAGYFKGNAETVDGINTSVDFASFYNTLLIRYLDFNDTYLSKEPLHPSDMIGGLIALGKMFDSTGKQLITAIAVGYEVGTRLCDSSSLRKRGFDHVLFLAVAEAAAASNLLGLDIEKTKNAVSLATVPNVALRETRSGSLSMWKAGAAANASRNAVFAAILAMNGITGPEKPFSGKMGLNNIILQDFDEKNFDKMGTTGILRTYIKQYPAEYHAQAAIEAALQIDYDGEIEEVEIDTYEAAKSILADDESKWNPKNRETADHSLPYMIAVTLVKKGFWLDSYSYINDPKVVSVMKRVKVYEDAGMTKIYPEKLPVRVNVRTKNGKKSAYLELPKGHAKRPLTDGELIEKATRLGLERGIAEKVMNLESIRVKEIVV